MIAADDRGFALGDGLFETLLVEDGAPADWDAHMRRLNEGCTALGLPAPAWDEVSAAVGEALDAASLNAGRCAVRITWTAGSGGRGLNRPARLEPRLAVTATPYQAPPGPVRLVISSIRRNEASPTSRHKTLNYLDNVLARREALAAGADEAVMLNVSGDVTCAASANLFWMAGEAIFTPALECAALAGTMRAKVIEACGAQGLRVREVRAGAAVLKQAQAIFLTNSLIGVLDAATLDGEELPQQVGHSIMVTLRGRR